MYRRIQDFLGVWAYETEATSKVFDALSDVSLRQPVDANGRTLGRIAWHIVQSIPEMSARTGLNVLGPGESEPIPDLAEEIGARFKASATSLGREIEDRWADADLEVEDDMYGEMWMRGKTLTALVCHQAHHRGQMTVLMRQSGLKVPGVYGPSREEWAEFGMPPQE
jgi:uncharacterized damage-inducible protein DinB